VPEDFLKERFSLKGGEKPCVTLVKPKREEKKKPDQQENITKEFVTEKNMTPSEAPKITDANRDVIYCGDQFIPGGSRIAAPEKPAKKKSLFA
jgi:hypothetical protein